MTEIAQMLFKPLIFVFLAGNLIDMGLRLDIKAAISGMKNVRFMIYTLLWGFILTPAMAFGIAHILPMEESYRYGLILVGLTPCAPFLAVMVDRAKGDLGLTAAFMLVSIALTIFLLPLELPLFIPGLTVTTWALFKPLLITMFIPLVTGMVILYFSKTIAARILPVLKKVTGVATILLGIDLLILFGPGMISSAGSFGILSLVIFSLLTATLPFWLAFGLKRGEKIVLVIGTTSRNVGAAIAPCVAIPNIDPKISIMVVACMFIMIFASLIVAKYHGPKGAKKEPDGERVFM
jgi:bile acid:Na+ symporter, BASS family